MSYTSFYFITQTDSGDVKSVFGIMISIPWLQLDFSVAIAAGPPKVIPGPSSFSCTRPSVSEKNHVQYRTLATMSRIFERVLTRTCSNWDAYLLIEKSPFRTHWEMKNLFQGCSHQCACFRTLHSRGAVIGRDRFVIYFLYQKQIHHVWIHI